MLEQLDNVRQGFEDGKIEGCRTRGRQSWSHYPKHNVDILTTTIVGNGRGKLGETKGNEASVSTL